MPGFLTTGDYGAKIQLFMLSAKFLDKKESKNMFLNIYSDISSLIFTKYSPLRARVNAVYIQR